jgi:hypothetical protein
LTGQPLDFLYYLWIRDNCEARSGFKVSKVTQKIASIAFSMKRRANSKVIGAGKKGFFSLLDPFPTLFFRLPCAMLIHAVTPGALPKGRTV